MKLIELYEKQKELDERIIKERNLDRRELLSNTVVATIVELSECSNETRFFKHWSNKPASPKSVILEEGVDVLHFMLSIGNMLNNDYIINKEYKPLHKNITLTKDFLDITKGLLQIEMSIKNHKYDLAEYIYIQTMSIFLSFLYKIGFSEKDIEVAYYKKNEINHRRQDSGY